MKDAGYVPPEFELMQQIEALRQRLADMRQKLTMQLEQLRGSTPR